MLLPKCKFFLNIDYIPTIKQDNKLDYLYDIFGCLEVD